jgi:ABC-2 type transport system permease protein
MNKPNMVSRSELKIVTGKWLRGFSSIYQKELAAWFATPRWASQLIIWQALAVIPPVTITPDGTNERGIAVLSLFLWSGSNMMSIGTILLAQGTIIEEKLTQTLLWVFSKPLSAAGFIVGKFAAYAVLLALLVIGAPCIVTYLAAMVIGLPAQIWVGNYLAGVGMVYLILLFVLALTILLGVLFDRQGAVTALALLIFFSGSGLKSNAQLGWIEPFTPWALQHNAHETLIGNFPGTAWLAIAVTLGLIWLLLQISIWRLQRYEF